MKEINLFVCSIFTSILLLCLYDSVNYVLMLGISFAAYLVNNFYSKDKDMKSRIEKLEDKVTKLLVAKGFK